MYPKPRFSGRRLAVLGVLAALSLAVHTIESAFPPLFGIPGAKLGLANLFSMLALVLYGPLDAILILLARTLLGAAIAGNASSLLFSLSGGGVSLLLAIVLVRFLVPRVSYLAVNIAAAVIHNIVQVAVFGDAENIWLRVETAENITAPCGEHWMNVLLGTGGGWNGLEYAVNRKIEGTKSHIFRIEQSSSGWRYADTGKTAEVRWTR